MHQHMTFDLPLTRTDGCGQNGRSLSWESGVEEVGFEVFPEGCYRGGLFLIFVDFQRTGA